MKRLAPRALGRIKLVKPKRLDEQTLTYPFDLDLAWFAVHYLRTPSRVVWDVGQFASTRLEPLYAEVRYWFDHGDAPGWMADGQTFSVAVRNVDEFEAGPLQVRGTIKNAIAEAAEDRRIHFKMDADHPIVRFLVRKNVVSVDLGGQSMHARGYRIEQGEAPLKENVAAQMLMLSRWDARKEILFDPMCGAGTIAIEADAMARGAPLWVGSRKPDAADIAAFADCSPEHPDLFPGTTGMIVGGDIDEEVITFAQRNAERAQATVDFSTRDFRSWTREAIAEAAGVDIDTPVLILTNPPYGERLEQPAMLHRELADWWRSLGPGVRFGILAEDGSIKNHLGMEPSLEKPLHNGPIKTRFLVYSSF